MQSAIGQIHKNNNTRDAGDELERNWPGASPRILLKQNAGNLVHCVTIEFEIGHLGLTTSGVVTSVREKREISD